MLNDQEIREVQERVDGQKVVQDILCIASSDPKNNSLCFCVSKIFLLESMRVVYHQSGA